MLWVSSSRKARDPALKFWSAASSMTALVCPSKSTGSTMMLTCRALPRLDEIEMKSGGTSLSRMRFFSTAHWPTRPSPSGDLVQERQVAAVRVAGEQPERANRRSAPERW